MGGGATSAGGANGRDGDGTAMETGDEGGGGRGDGEEVRIMMGVNEHMAFFVGFNMEHG